MMDASARTGIGRKFKNIFELGGVPAFEQFYTFGIFPWKMIYRGYYEPWHKIAAPSIAKPYATRKIEPSCLAKAVCAELAGLCWSEECAVVVSQGDGEAQRQRQQSDKQFLHVVFSSLLCYWIQRDSVLCSIHHGITLSRNDQESGKN